jgi:hypothetical protein
MDKEEKKFLVHKVFACHYSPVLSAALNNTAFIEGETQIYRLDDTTEGAFGLLVQWLYSQKLEYDDGAGGVTAENLVRLWVLAGKLLIPRLQNLAVDLLEEIRVAKGSIPIKELEYVYENTKVLNPLRKYLVYVCARHLDANAYIMFPRNFPKVMLLELAVTFKFNMMAPERQLAATDMTQFHIEERE